MTNTEILTPFDISLAVQVQNKAGKLFFWKKILPVLKADYLGTKLDFNNSYMDDLLLAFREKALDQTPFVLADKDNAHTMNPEQFRGEVVDMRKYEDLPADVRLAMDADNNGGPGLYGKIEFPDQRSADAVLRNPKLGVSARIREGISRIDGKKWTRGVIHVLGTLDPRATGMGKWHPVDLSNDGDTVVLDFSRAYPERNAEMAKGTNTGRSLDEITDEDIDAMTDEEVDAFLAANGIDPDAVLSDGGEDEDNDDEEEDESGDEDESDEEDESESESDDESSSAHGAREMAGAALSNSGQSDTELAYAAAASANERANEALRRMAAAEWKESRSAMIRDGIPPYMVDLAEPILSRPNQMVVDLSNSGDDDVNVSEILLSMLEGAKGFVDMSSANGHTGQVNSAVTDEDKNILDAWESEYPA